MSFLVFALVERKNEKSSENESTALPKAMKATRTRALSSTFVGAIELGEEHLCFEVASLHDGLRLDRYAADQVSDLSRSYARQLIEDAHIRLNGADARPSSLVHTGDIVTVQRPVAQPTDLVAQDIPLNIVYEDADLVVIDKP